MKAKQLEVRGCEKRTRALGAHPAIRSEGDVHERRGESCTLFPGLPQLQAHAADGLIQLEKVSLGYLKYWTVRVRS
jgi:hypothetical protein